MIVAQCFTLLTFEIWEPVPYKLLLTLSFKIWDFGYNNMEISILNNPLYIAYTLHPGSKRAKVLPELCPLVPNIQGKLYQTSYNCQSDNFPCNICPWEKKFPFFFWLKFFCIQLFWKENCFLDPRFIFIPIFYLNFFWTHVFFTRISLHKIFFVLNTLIPD